MQSTTLIENLKCSVCYILKQALVSGCITSKRITNVSIRQQQLMTIAVKWQSNACFEPRTKCKLKGTVQ